MSNTNDIQALLASIRPRPSPSSTPAQDPGAAYYSQHYQQGYRPQPQQQAYDGQGYPIHPHLHQQAYRHPSVSSALHSPSPANFPPRHGSDVLSPNVVTPGEYPPQQPQPHNPDRSVNLLNLLKFNQPNAGPAQQPTPMMGEPPVHTHPSAPVEDASRSHARNLSAGDLVANLMGGAGQVSTASPGQPAVQPAPESHQPAAPSAESTQDMLLRLLNRPKHGQQSSDSAIGSPAASIPSQPPGLGQENAPPIQGAVDPLGLAAEKSEKPSPAANDTIFAHVNPFEQLAAVSRGRTPQPFSRGESPVVEVNKTEDVVTTEVGSLPPPQPAGAVRPQPPSLDGNQKEAVNNVVDKLVEQIVKDVDESYEKQTQSNGSPAPVPDDNVKKTLLSTTTTVQDANGDTEVLKETTEEIATGIPETSNGNGEALLDSWESAEDSAEKEEVRVVPVQQFPLQPFISIVVKPHAGKLSSLRDDGIMDIARLKKDFDQLDRSLTSATPDYIVYALAKNGGMRIIRQDDGSDKQVLRSTRDRIFNVSVCTSQAVGGSSNEQAVLGIGVSGAVYWVLISRGDDNLFYQDALESASLIFPPFPASDENTSGGQLKTRAKRSSCHPAFFAIGRGKNIYVLSPQSAAKPAYGVSGNNRTVNTELFFKERALKISTGKAGKDFVFSADDTVVASLDKTGRLRFWDIREVVNSPDPEIKSSEIRTPLNTFVTGSPTEKSWPTSVLFIDKLRPYVKSMALRYVLVGLKQNHTLQLWDIGLGKAVQELKFPHQHESDAICSVAFHPASGILVVGNPTRNSIYFVHLSAPKYNLHAMSQASFIKRAAEKDSSLPKPDSTACLSGIREISFASKGQLRSLDLLPITKAAGEDSGLFELYVMHSRGVTCLNINKGDLGWDKENKIIRPVDALKGGLIEIADLQPFPPYIADDFSVNGDSTNTPTKVVPKEFAKATAETAPESSVAAGATPSILRAQSPTKAAPKKKQAEEPVETASPGIPEKSEKKKNKKKAASVEPKKETPILATTQDQLVGDQLNGEASKAAAPKPTVTGTGANSPDWNKHIEALQDGVMSEFNKSLGRELQGLYSRLDEERRSWDAASASKQEQVLRLVSSTLSENVEKTLGRTVSAAIQSEVVPALGELTSAAVSKQLNTVLSQQAGVVISRELKQSLPDAVSRAVQQPNVMKVMSDALGQKLSAQVESQISKSVNDTLAPTLKTVAIRAAEKVGSDAEKRMQAQAKQLEVQRQADAAKIDQLTNLVRGLSDTVTAMAATQTGFQQEVLRLNQIIAAQTGTPVTQTPANIPANPPAPSPGPVSHPLSPDEREIADVAQLMQEGKYEEGSVMWLKSAQQANLFDRLFVHLNPTYLNGLSPFVVLSVGVAVTSSLQTNVMERLSWLEIALQTLDLRDAEIRDVAPRIMDILEKRLDALYMTVAQEDPHSPILRRIPSLARRVRELYG